MNINSNFASSLSVEDSDKKPAYNILTIIFVHVVADIFAIFTF